MARRVLLLLAISVSLSACSDGHATQSEPPAWASRPHLSSKWQLLHNDWRSVDFERTSGVNISWPPASRIFDRRVTQDRLAGEVDLIVLATFTPAPAGNCSPVSRDSLEAMGLDDAIFVLTTDEPSREPAPPRPPELTSHASPLGGSNADAPRQSQGCYPPGVAAWQLRFTEHGRVYTAFLAAKSPISKRRRAEVEQIWSSLDLRPISTGAQFAEVGRAYWHVLHTHCGIRGTRFAQRDWVADPPLLTEGPNPSAGWANPFEVGTMKMSTSERAIFISRDGERTAQFRLRLPTDPAVPPCD